MMEKNIKDYISLYIGCDLQTPDLIGKNLGLFYVEEIGYFNGVNVRYPKGKVYVQNYNQVKLILRPLSSMSGEEMKELASIKDELIIDQLIQAVYNLANPERVRFFLSKHFDLFGLIESGLAIDATKYKP